MFNTEKVKMILEMFNMIQAYLFLKSMLLVLDGF